MGLGEDLFSHWQFLESMVHGKNKRVTSITPVPRASGCHLAWRPLPGSHEGGKQDNMLKYVQRTVAGKEELGLKEQCMLFVVSNYAQLFHFTY